MAKTTIASELRATNRQYPVGTRVVFLNAAAERIAAIVTGKAYLDEQVATVNGYPMIRLPLTYTNGEYHYEVSPNRARALRIIPARGY